MASDKPGIVEQEQEDQVLSDELVESLMSMENLDRPSPELWPEKIPGIRDFISNFQSTPQSVSKSPYSRELTPEDQNYLHQLASLSTAGLISKVKELHDITYQLGVEESREVTRGKYLNLFNKPKNNT
ncbi:protein lin-52 homolog [Aethina tumida]|uniref:protein lin-52 homolog n=1 Tax=Aethina tumida TaxID=116153 RepID=UPI00096B5719|nr:protein lin-52 homolog [Aethina tumida]XP_019877601.1 protein lin-52 homolog [Aethina tumida]